MKKLALVSGANERYAAMLEEMLDSLGPSLSELSLKIIDLGLTEATRRRVRTYQPSAEFVTPGWMRPFPGCEQTGEHKKVFVAKPFIPELFPGHSGYFWVDADIWFSDATALEDYALAARETGAAFSFESHPMYCSTQKVRYLRLGNRTLIKGIKDYFFNKTREMFGNRLAAELGIHPILNSGLFYLTAASPIWAAWRDMLREANLSRHYRSTQICDQTCLQVALLRRNLPYATMPATHNWLPKLAAPILDRRAGTLLDPAFPHLPVKAIHLSGSASEAYTLPVKGGGRLQTPLKWRDFKNLREGIVFENDAQNGDII